MGSSEPKAPKPAYVYEVDEDGRAIKGTRESASKKDEKRSSHKRRESERKVRSDSGTAREMVLMSGARQDDKDKKDRRRSIGAGSSPSKSKPPSSHENKHRPKIAIPNEQPSYYGISPVATHAPLPVRPAPYTAQTFPQRPQSWAQAPYTVNYGTQPPLSKSAYYQTGYAQSPMIMPTPQSYPPATNYLQNYTPTSEYFPAATGNVARPLEQRFDPPSRPTSAFAPTRTTSAFGNRETVARIQDAYDDGYASATEGKRPKSIRISTGTRKEIPRRSKREEDYEAMPPPPRPSSTRPIHSILRNGSKEYHPDLPYAPSPVQRESRSTYHTEDPPRRRPSLNRSSVTYDLGDHTVELANKGRRRQSYYGQSASLGTGFTSASGAGLSASDMEWEDKAAQARNYQEGVQGPEPIPLTAEMLHRQQRRQAGSSRSTKSSGSRDESDYRKGPSTRTTRSVSSPDDENVTIKVSGGARVVVGDTQIHCDDGGEISINRQKSLRNGSERSGSEYGDPVPRRGSRLGRSSRSGESYLGREARQDPRLYTVRQQDGGWV